MSPPAGISGQSAESHTTVTCFAPAAFASSATRSAYWSPAASWSGRITTSRPASGDQSLLSADLLPCAEVVATTPSERVASAAFSPSATKIGAPSGAASSSGSAYSGRGSCMPVNRHKPSSPRDAGRILFSRLPSRSVSQRATRPTTSPFASW
jgi:hypothetical protein